MRRNEPGLYVAIEGFDNARVHSVQHAVAGRLLEAGYGVLTRSYDHSVAYQQVIWDILDGRHPSPDLEDFLRLFVMDELFLNMLEFVPAVVGDGKALVTVRSPLATFAYGAVLGIDTSRLYTEVAGQHMALSGATPFSLWPDATVFLDVPPEEMQLAASEGCPEVYRACFDAVKVREAFLTLARESDQLLQPVIIVDANTERTDEAVVADVLAALERELFTPPAVP